MEPRDWIAIIGVLSTATVSVVSLIINAIREKRQQERKAEEDEKKRTYAPRIEFEVKINFYGGSEREDVITEILITIRNKGLVRQNFKDIRLRVRGIKEKQTLSFWEGYEPRLNFPVKLVEDVSFLPGSYNFFFVEPGCEQVITYVTKIPANIQHILAHAEFEYDRFTPHTVERVFPVMISPAHE